MDECLLNSYNAFQKFENTGVPLLEDLSNLDSNYKHFFYTKRCLVRPAYEYYLLHWAYRENIEIINSDSFNELLVLHKDKLLDYQKIFFRERNRLRLINKKKWLQFHSLYNNMAESWDSLSHIYNIFIVSNKDKVSIILLLNYFKLCLKENRIFGAEFGNEKSKIILNIMNDTSTNPEDIYFIDDNLDNLKSVKHLNIKLFHAMWGYVNTEESQQSEVEKIYLDNIFPKLT